MHGDVRAANFPGLTGTSILPAKLHACKCATGRGRPFSVSASSKVWCVESVTSKSFLIQKRKKMRKHELPCQKTFEFKSGNGQLFNEHEERFGDVPC